MWPSRSQVGGIVDTASTVVCYANVWRRAKLAIGLCVLTFLVHWATSGAEDLEDIVGIIEDVVDSHQLEDVTVTEVEADRVNHTAEIVPGSSRTEAHHRQRKRPDGTIVHSTTYTCNGPTLRFKGTGDKPEEVPCGSRAGACKPTTGYVSVFKNGLRACVLGVPPTVHCRINGSAQACHHKVACPEVGATVSMARSTKDDTLACAQGNWNTSRVTVRYVAPGAPERTQTFPLPMAQPGAVRYPVGSSLPVYYSRKHRRIALEDSNMATLAGRVVAVFALLALAQTLNAASFLSKRVCAVRLGLQVAHKLDDKLGFDLI